MAKFPLQLCLGRSFAQSITRQKKINCVYLWKEPLKQNFEANTMKNGIDYIVTVIPCVKALEGKDTKKYYIINSEITEINNLDQIFVWLFIWFIFSTWCFYLCRIWWMYYINLNGKTCRAQLVRTWNYMWYY